MGRDVSGTLVTSGADVRNLKSSQQVIGLVKGSYAEYITAQADDLTVIPDGLDPAESAALPLVVTTGAQLIQHIAPKPGDVVLITGASGSLGRAAVYLAKRLSAQVIAGIRRVQKKEASLLSVEVIVGLDADDEIAGLPTLDATADTSSGRHYRQAYSEIESGRRARFGLRKAQRS